MTAANSGMKLSTSQRMLYFGLRRLNPFMKRLLRSRWHRLASRNILLLTFTGRTSQRLYTTPVTYIREEQHIVIATPRACRWWTNLWDGVEVGLLVAGRSLSGRVTVIADDEAEKRARIRRILELVPRDARYYPVALDRDGRPDPDDLESAARQHVVIVIRLDVSAAEAPSSSAA